MRLRSGKFGMRLLSTGLALLFAVSPAFAVDPEAEANAEAQKQPAELSEKETAFAEQLKDSVLIGHFTVVGNNDGQAGKPERYEIKQISKVNDSMWMFQTRIKYGNVDTIMPLVLPVEWAGNTPVVSLTNFTIPGMGTFSCRVLFHGDRYAGTWQHGEKGGHMWGLIEKAKK